MVRIASAPSRMRTMVMLLPNRTLVSCVPAAAMARTVLTCDIVSLGQAVHARYEWIGTEPDVTECVDSTILDDCHGRPVSAISDRRVLGNRRWEQLLKR